MGIKVTKVTNVTVRPHFDDKQHNHTHTHVYLTKQATRMGEAPIVLATRDRLTDKKEIDRRKKQNYR